MRQLKCRRCGAIYLSDKQESSLCPECVKIARKEAVYRSRICIDCGRPFMGYPKSKRCPDCQQKAYAENNKKHKHNGSARKLGTQDICPVCGKPYTVTSGAQKYCPKCAPDAIRENINKSKREYAKSNYNHQERKDNKEGRKICVICGKPFTSTMPCVTCSPECAKEQARMRQVAADIKRGRANPARLIHRKRDEVPQSGIPGITWHNGKWQLTIHGKYIGIYSTIEEAEEAKKGREENRED